MLLRGRLSICASPDYWLRRGKPQHPRDLEQHNCLVLNRADAPLRHWRFEDNGAPLTIKVRGDHSAGEGDTLRHWAIAGTGVIIKASWDIADDVAAGRLETALEHYAVRDMDLYAVYPGHRETTRRLSAFIAHVSQRLSSAFNGARPTAP